VRLLLFIIPVFYFSNLFGNEQLENSNSVSSFFVDSKIIKEDFEKNKNNWIFSDDKSTSLVSNDALELTSLNDNGASRYLNYSILDSDFKISAIIDITGLKAGSKCGIIYGFKDWRNYNFFLITNKTYYIGSYKNGELFYKSDDFYSPNIVMNAKNKLEITSSKNQYAFTINGIEEIRMNKIESSGSGIGFVVSGTNKMKVHNFELILPSKSISSDEEIIPNSLNVNLIPPSTSIFYENPKVYRTSLEKTSFNNIIFTNPTLLTKGVYSLGLERKIVDNITGVLTLGIHKYQDYARLIYLNILDLDKTDSEIEVDQLIKYGVIKNPGFYSTLGLRFYFSNTHFEGMYLEVQPLFDQYSIDLKSVTDKLSLQLNSSTSTESKIYNFGGYLKLGKQIIKPGIIKQIHSFYMGWGVKATNYETYKKNQNFEIIKNDSRKTIPGFSIIFGYAFGLGF
jgi:hypothetical protein